MSKPVLYTFGLSVWSAAAELAIAEAKLDVETKIINIPQGENFSPELLSLNPNGTLPTLTAEGKTYVNSTDVVRYLVAKAGKKAGNTALIEKIHDDGIDPNLILLTARNDEELKAAASGFPIEFATNRQAALEKYSATPEGAPFKQFYDSKKVANGGVVKVYKGEVPPTEFFAMSTSHWERIVSFIKNELATILPENGFIDGAEPGETDYHYGAWIARVTWVAGGNKEADGYQALKKELKEDVSTKVAAYWKAWSSRPSWSEVYGETLH